MATVRKVEFTRRKRHLRHDATRGVWIGYQVDVRSNGKRHRDTFATKRDAERFIDELRLRTVRSRAGLQTAKRSTVTVRKLFDRRLAMIANEKEIVRATRVFNAFLELFDYPIAVTDVRTAHFQNYINSRDGVKPETANREITILSTAFKQAVRIFPEELENFEPPRIARPEYKKGKRRRRIITEREKSLIIESIINQRTTREKRVRTDSRPAIAQMFELAWMLGLRFSETKRLLKTDYRNGTLRVVRWKTGNVTMLEYLPARVVEILDAAESSTENIFEVYCSDHTFADVIRDACEANGIVYGRSEIDGVTFHSTRHSFTSRLVQVTDMATAGSFTGHSSLEMVDYYSHPTNESKRRAMESLYGGKSTERLREIFDKVASGEMDFEAFRDAVSRKIGE